MERSVTGLLGGGLKPNDPRRFLIEAMIGAMNADGVVDPRETAAIEQQIASHPLFIAYSLVIQPSPSPFRKGGTPSSTEAVHTTRVSPSWIRAEPSALET